MQQREAVEAKEQRHQRRVACHLAKVERHRVTAAIAAIDCAQREAAERAREARAIEHQRLLEAIDRIRSACTTRSWPNAERRLTAPRRSEARL
jgi:hypothetical protein